MSKLHRMAPLPVIFLDIHGVLSFYESPHKMAGHGLLPEETLDPGAISRLNKLVFEVGGAEIVVSSTWRTIYGAEGCERILHTAGVIAPIIGATPNFAMGGGCHYTPRSEEIRFWLSQNDPDSQRPYLILDDEANAGVEGHFVLCSWVHGFGDQMLEAAIECLREQMK